MKYLEKTIKFLYKNYLLLAPFYLLSVIPALFNQTGSSNIYNTVKDLIPRVNDPLDQVQDPARIFGILTAVLTTVVWAGFFTFVLRFILMPAAYGAINRTLETNALEMNDFSTALSQNFVKYLLYWVGSVAVLILFCIAAFILLLILGLLTVVLKWVGVILILLVSLALAITGIVIAVSLSLWFSAMVVDNLDIMAALKKSVEIAKTSFWTILGISALVAVAGGILGGILSFLNSIPLIGPIIYSVVPAATGTVMVVFYLLLYREKTGKTISAA